MPTSHRTQRPVRPSMDRTVQVTGTPRFWPASLAATALIVFAMFQMTTSPVIALIVALATAAAGVLAGTRIFGTGRSRRTPSRVSAPGRR
jgi:Na+-transporting NADH:ubiquinone oxidoreductase subunit NqrB